MATRPRRSIDCCPGPLPQTQADSQVTLPHRLQSIRSRLRIDWFERQAPSETLSLEIRVRIRWIAVCLHRGTCCSSAMARGPDEAAMHLLALTGSCPAGQCSRHSSGLHFDASRLQKQQLSERRAGLRGVLIGSLSQRNQSRRLLLHRALVLQQSAFS